MSRSDLDALLISTADGLSLVALLPDDIVLSLVEPELEALRGKVGPNCGTGAKRRLTRPSSTGLAP